MIFEGDIIRYATIDAYNSYLESLNYPEDYQDVSFDDIWTVDEVIYGIDYGYPAFDLSDHDFDANGLSYLKNSGQYYFEVIGNVHDNYDLL